jgi:hypothetical protein
MHRQHCIGIGSLARYIGEAMNGPPKCHAFIMMEKSFDIPDKLFYLASIPNKNKWEDDLKAANYLRFFTILVSGAYQGVRIEKMDPGN